MEYRSPLGYNFKLQESLSACKEETAKETPKKGEDVQSSNSGRRFFESNTRNLGRNSNSPAWQRRSNNWKSPNYRNYQQNDSSCIELYYHPSMLENPWEELEKNIKTT